MTVIGELPHAEAEVFVANHPSCRLYSKSSRGTTRIATDATGELLETLRLAIPGGESRGIGFLRPHCKHLGSRRTCCGQLYLCKIHPGESCSPSGAAPDGVLNCQTCTEYQNSQ